MARLEMFSGRQHARSCASAFRASYGDMIKTITIWLAAVLAALAFAPAAGAVTTTLNATADSRVESAQPDGNYGPYNLKAQLGAIRSYLKFDLASLPAGTVTQATLRVAPISD